MSFQQLLWANIIKSEKIHRTHFDSLLTLYVGQPYSEFPVPRQKAIGERITNFPFFWGGCEGKEDSGDVKTKDGRKSRNIQTGCKEYVMHSIKHKPRVVVITCVWLSPPPSTLMRIGQKRESLTRAKSNQRLEFVVSYSAVGAVIYRNYKGKHQGWGGLGCGWRAHSIFQKKKNFVSFFTFPPQFFLRKISRRAIRDELG